MLTPTQRELDAIQAARDAGVPLRESPRLPYFVISRTPTENQTPWDYTWESDKPETMPTVIWRSSSQPGWSCFWWRLTEAEARADAESLNVRHFDIMARSKNPRNPVCV